MERYWPLGNGRILTSGFRTSDRPDHQGIDFGRSGGSAGMPVYAAQAGRVQYAGPASGFGGPDPAGWVVIDHPADAGAGTTVYGHIVREVAVGQQVRAGQRIGHINPDGTRNGGTAARPLAPHLHFEVHNTVWTASPAGRRDPWPWLAGSLEPEDPREEAPMPENPIGLTPERLAAVMGNRVSMDRYRQLFPAVVECMISCDCTTVERAAMWHAQIGHEGVGLHAMREYASGAEYEGRRDLGNIYPGDGVRFAGRGPIQVTGRHNYGVLSRWAHERGFVDSPTFFVDNPEALESDQWGFMGVTWYWTSARNMNKFADARDIRGATYAVNGGYNGLDDRVFRYNRALAMGADIVPNGVDEEMSFWNEMIDNFKGVRVGRKDLLWFLDRNASQARDQLLGEDDEKGNFKGWPILGKSKVDPNRSNTFVEALAEHKDDTARKFAEQDALLKKIANKLGVEQ